MPIQVAVSPADRTTFTSPALVDETGTGGILRAIGVSGGVRKHLFEIEIDGTTVLADSVPNALDKPVTDSTVYGGQQTHNSMGVNLSFERSLTIRVKDEPVRCARPRFWAIYETDIPGRGDVGGAREGRGPSTTEFRNGFVVERHERETGGDPNVGSVLQGRSVYARPELEPYNDVEQDVYRVGESVWAEVRTYNWRGEPSVEWGEYWQLEPGWFPPVLDAPEVVDVLLRVPGRNYPIDEFSVDWQGEDGLEFSVATPGEYELVTTFPEFGNVPATFTVLPE